MFKSTVLVIDKDDATLKWFSGFLSNAGYKTRTARSGLEGLRMLDAEPPNLVILDLSPPDLTCEQVVEAIVHNPTTTNIPILILSRQNNSGRIVRLFEKGISDFIPKKPGIEAELLGKCVAALSRARRNTSLLLTGRLISFFSAKGGNGTSTLCLNLAHMLSRQVAPKTVLVADMVLPLGSLAIETGVRQTKSIAELTNEGGPYDYSKINKFLTPAEGWNFSILQGSRNPYDAQTFSPDQVEPLFESLLLQFNYVAVDLGKTLSRISLPILRSSDCVVMVLGSDLVTVDLSLAAIKYLEDAGICKEKMFLILNRAVGRNGLTKPEIESRFNMPIQGTVPYAQDNFTLTSNQHKPYIHRFPNDATMMALDDLASKMHKQIKAAV